MTNLTNLTNLTGEPSGLVVDVDPVDGVWVYGLKPGQRLTVDDYGQRDLDRARRARRYVFEGTPGGHYDAELIDEVDLPALCYDCDRPLTPAQVRDDHRCSAHHID